MSDLANSMKLGEDIDFDELLPYPLLFAFVLSSFHSFYCGGGGGWSYFGLSEYKITPI